MKNNIIGKIEKEKINGEDYSCLNAIVNQEYGIAGRQSAWLCKQSYMNERTIYLKNLTEPTKISECNDIMSVLSGSFGKGYRIRIKVQGSDEEAENLVKYIYDAITSKEI
jgi:phosphotransferase system HPr-like phosphotransfer protein